MYVVDVPQAAAKLQAAMQMGANAPIYRWGQMPPSTDGGKCPHLHRWGQMPPSAQDAFNNGVQRTDRDFRHKYW